MMSTYVKNNWFLGLNIVALLFFCVSLPIHAQQESQTLSISPTLYEVKANPGQVWQSELRIVNVNLYDLIVYPEIFDFIPLGEDGRGDFIPRDLTSTSTLASWIKISKEPVLVPKQQTVSIPVTVSTPNDAAPGGHYAAVLVGTKPPSTDETGASLVQTAQFVTSLFFVRIAGDVIEDGSIREFMTTKSIMQSAEAKFEIRFENKGNVHLRPQGDITITNMWGDVRGEIPINHQTNFGNVLPQSIRKYSFSWTSDTALYDMGRYKAVATLGYGDEAKKFVTSTTYFWVIPYKFISLFILFIITIYLAGSWLVRRYIEKMLILSGVPLHQKSTYESRRFRDSVDSSTMVIKNFTVTSPVRSGLSDLVSAWRQHKKLWQKVKAFSKILYEYRNLLLLLVLFILTATILAIGVKNMTIDRVPYEVNVTHDGSQTKISSEDVAFEKLQSAAPLNNISIISTSSIDIVNTTATDGLGAQVKYQLVKAGYTVRSLRADLDRRAARTVIVFRPSALTDALALSKILKDAPLSSVATDSDLPFDIVIYVGEDMSPK